MSKELKETKESWQVNGLGRCGIYKVATIEKEHELMKQKKKKIITRIILISVLLIILIVGMIIRFTCY